MDLKVHLRHKPHQTHTHTHTHTQSSECQLIEQVRGTRAQGCPGHTPTLNLDWSGPGKGSLQPSIRPMWAVASSTPPTYFPSSSGDLDSLAG